MKTLRRLLVRASSQLHRRKKYVTACRHIFLRPINLPLESQTSIGRHILRTRHMKSSKIFLSILETSDFHPSYQMERRKRSLLISFPSFS